MHEFSVCQGLVSALFAQPMQLKGQELTAIEVTIGPLSGIEVQLFEHAYPLVVESTPFKDISLKLVCNDIKVSCENCHQLSVATINDLRCRHCHSVKVRVTEGDECALTHLFYGGKGNGGDEHV